MTHRRRAKPCHQVCHGHTGTDPPRCCRPAKASQEVTSEITSVTYSCRGAELGCNTDLPGTQIPSAEAGRNATLSLPRHGHGARRPLSSRTGEHGSRGARQRALLVSPRGRKMWGSPNVALGHPARAAAALSQREWVHGATALIWQRLPPTLHSRTRCRATGRGAPPEPPQRTGSPYRRFQPRTGSESSTERRGRAGHIPLPGQSPRTTARGGRAGMEAAVTKRMRAEPGVVCPVEEG